MRPLSEGIEDDGILSTCEGGFLMGIGASLLLIATGAVLVFAVDFSISGLEISMIGWILMVVGALGLLAVLVIWTPRRRAAGRTVEERRIYDDPTS